MVVSRKVYRGPSHSLSLFLPLCETYYRVHAETAGVASEKPVGVTWTIYVLMQMHIRIFESEVCYASSTCELYYITNSIIIRYKMSWHCFSHNVPRSTR